MARLMQAAEELQQSKAAPKSLMASTDLGIAKETAQRWVSSDLFYYMAVPIDKLPMLAGEILSSHEAPQHMVVVDINKNKINRSVKYIPKVAVLCGSQLVQNARRKGEILIDCWVGAKAAKALKLKLPKVEANLAMLSKLGFNPSPETPQGIFSLPTNMMKNRSASFPDAVDYGAPGSELNNPTQFMSMLNIQEALDMYLNNLKDGIWKPVSSQWADVPPSLKNATNEAGLIAKEKGLTAFAPLDFVKWQMSVLEAPVKYKYVDGKRLTASKFAFVGDTEDPSTWLFRADSKDSISSAIDELMACKYINKKAKMLTLQELKRRSHL